MSVGQKYGIRNAGYYALRSLRIEKFFAFWGQDLNTLTTPLECGGESRVKLDKVLYSCAYSTPPSALQAGSLQENRWTGAEASGCLRDKTLTKETLCFRLSAFWAFSRIGYGDSLTCHKHVQMSHITFNFPIFFVSKLIYGNALFKSPFKRIKFSFPAPRAPSPPASLTRSTSALSPCRASVQSTQRSLPSLLS